MDEDQVWRDPSPEEPPTETEGETPEHDWEQSSDHWTDKRQTHISAQWNRGNKPFYLKAKPIKLWGLQPEDYAYDNFRKRKTVNCERVVLVPVDTTDDECMQIKNLAKAHCPRDVIQIVRTRTATTKDVDRLRREAAQRAEGAASSSNRKVVPRGRSRGRASAF